MKQRRIIATLEYPAFLRIVCLLYERIKPKRWYHSRTRRLLRRDLSLYLVKFHLNHLFLKDERLNIIRNRTSSATYMFKY